MEGRFKTSSAGPTMVFWTYWPSSDREYCRPSAGGSDSGRVVGGTFKGCRIGNVDYNNGELQSVRGGWSQDDWVDDYYTDLIGPQCSGAVGISKCGGTSHYANKNEPSINYTSKRTIILDTCYVQL